MRIPSQSSRAVSRRTFVRQSLIAGGADRSIDEGVV